MLLARGQRFSGGELIYGVYAPKGWPAAQGTSKDAGALLFNLVTGAKAVPVSGIADVVTGADLAPNIAGALSCKAMGPCTVAMTAFACTDGATGESCKAKISSLGSDVQHAVEAFVQLP